MIWFLYAPLQILLMLICYVTNPIVCLFADETGNLPRIFRMWQTWDDCCDVDFFVKEEVPAWMRYDFDKHYQPIVMYPRELVEVGRYRYGVTLKNPNFTLKERLQRYLCRVGWLTRNCGYGFAFWCFGMNVKGEDMVMTTLLSDDKGHFIRIGYDKSRPLWRRPWMIHHEWPIYGRLRSKHYLGWKCNYNSGKELRRAMLARRISFKIEKG